MTPNKFLVGHGSAHDDDAGAATTETTVAPPAETTVPPPPVPPDRGCSGALLYAAGPSGTLLSLNRASRHCRSFT